MNNPITALTDKVMQTTKSMVYMAMRMSGNEGITATEIAGYLRERIPSGPQFHEGLVEGLLHDLYRDGRVERSGARWYSAGVTG